MRHQIVKSPNLFFVGTRNPPSSGFQEIKKTSPGHWNIKEHHVLWFHLRKEWLWFATGFSHVVYLRPTKKTRSKQIYTESEKIDGTWLTGVLCAKFTSHHSGSGHHHQHHLLGSTGRPDVPRRNCLNVARRERVDARVVPPNVQEGHPFARFCGGGGGSVGYLIYSRHIKQWFPLRRPY